MEGNILNASATKRLIYVALFVALIFVGSKSTVNASIVPFTLQTLVVMLAACVLGLKGGLLAVLAYTVMGLIGIPVFAKGGGFQYVLEPSFGYVLSFIPAVIFMAPLSRRYKGNVFALSGVLFAGGLIMLAVGAAYAYILVSATSGVSDAANFIKLYFAIFIPAELIKAVAAGLVYNRIYKHINSK